MPTDPVDVCEECSSPGGVGDCAVCGREGPTPSATLEIDFDPDATTSAPPARPRRRVVHTFSDLRIFLGGVDVTDLVGLDADGGIPLARP